MHDSSMMNMDRCIKKYVEPLLRENATKRLKVIDIGSSDINGTYRALFDEKLYDYVGVDAAKGKGVDLEIRDPYHIPIEDNYADVVISGQMLEHNEFFWLTFSEKMRIVNDK